MIGKPVIGKSFKGVVRYTLDKEGARILDYQDIRVDNLKNIASDFNAVRMQNPKLNKAVWHSILSFAYEDKMDDGLMKQIAKDFIQKLDLDRSQYLIVRHCDTDHDHLHIISNRVRADGSVVPDRFSKNRCAKACDELEIQYGLVVAREQRKKSITSDKIPPKKAVKLKIYNALQLELGSRNHSLQSLKVALGLRGIEMEIQKQKTGRINGITFKIDGLAFKGSAIDKCFSYGRLIKQLNPEDKPENSKMLQTGSAVNIESMQVMKTMAHVANRDAREAEFEEELSRRRNNQNMSHD